MFVLLFRDRMCINSCNVQQACVVGHCAMHLLSITVVLSCEDWSVSCFICIFCFVK